MATSKAQIEITAEDKTRAAFQRAESGLKSLQSSATRLNGALGAIGIGVGLGGLASMVKTTIDAADNMRDLAIATGTSVKALASYELAAKQSGTDIEAMAKGLGRMTVFMGDNADEAKRLGITATDPVRAFQQLAAALENARTPAERNALANKVLGRSYIELMPLLAQGSDELSRQSQASGAYAERMAKLADEADKFNDSLAKLKQSIGSVAVDLAGPLVTAINQTIDRFNAAQTAGRGFFGSLGRAVGGQKLSDRAREVNRDLEEAQQTLARREAAAKSGARNLGPLGRSIVESRIESARQRVRDLRAELQTINREADAIIASQQPAAPKPTPTGVPVAPGKFTGSNAAAALRKKVEAQNAEFDRLAEMRDYQIQQDEQAAAALGAAMTAANDTAFDRLAEMRDHQIQQDEQAAASLGALRDRYINLIDPIETYRKQLEEVRTLADAGLITRDQAIEAEFAIQEQIDGVAKLGDELKKTKDFAEDFGLTFNSALEDALVNGKRFSDVLKSLEQDIARIIIRKSVTEPLGNAVSGILGKIDFGKIFGFGGGKAAGGPVYPGQYYVVGEHGPEVLLPNTAGTVIPNSALGGGGGGVQIIQHISVDSRSDRSSILAAMNAAKDAAKAEIMQSMQRGGAFARATGRA